VAFRTLFAGSPVKRIGHDRFLRNVLIAIGNTGDAAFVAPVIARLDDPAAVVRGAAVWALGRLAPERVAGEAATRFAAEPEDDVRAEWEAARAISASDGRGGAGV